MADDPATPQRAGRPRKRTDKDTRLSRRAYAKLSLSAAKRKPGARSRNPEPVEEPEASHANATQFSTGRLRKNTKRAGEFSEAAFLVKATGMGFSVAKPWGDSERYDFIVACAVVDEPEFFWRVQIKCTEIVRARAYEVRAAYTVGKHRATYTADDIDFLIAHVVPRDIWYVLPVAACMPSPLLRFYPDGARRARFERYREAWHLLRARPRRVRHEKGPPGGGGDSLMADS